MTPLNEVLNGRIKIRNSEKDLIVIGKSVFVSRKFATNNSDPIQIFLTYTNLFIIPNYEKFLLLIHITLLNPKFSHICIYKGSHKISTQLSTQLTHGYVQTDLKT